jgi:hypothetical protein
MNAIGSRRWAIADNYIPSWSNGPEPEMLSHESISLLNTTDQEAHVLITAFFSDREPIGPYRVEVPPRRTQHIRLNNLDAPAALPRGIGFSTVIEADIPVVVQQTRLDSRQTSNALMTTIAYAG